MGMEGGAMYKKGGPVKKKMKKKSKFPDHSGDGKITKKDISPEPAAILFFFA